MQNRKPEMNEKSNFRLLRQVAEGPQEQNEGPKAHHTQGDPLAQVTCRLGDSSCARAHISRMQKDTSQQSMPSTAPDSLQRLQRQYGNRYVQRVLSLSRKEDGSGEVNADVEKAIQRERGSGQALSSEVRAQMEPAFGADFSGVRVHTGANADSLNRSLSARAFTTGQDIFFKQGEYSPGSSGGRELLAHELTHVVQQNGDKVQTKLTLGQPGDRYEQEADRVASAVIQQESRPVQKEDDRVRRQVEPEEEEEEETLQAKLKADQIQRQAEAVEEEEREPVNMKADDSLAQRQLEEEEEPPA